MSKKKKQNQIQRISSTLTARATEDLQKEIERSLKDPHKIRTIAELAAAGQLEPLVADVEVDLEQLEEEARKKEGIMIDKLDGGMGAVI